MVLHDHDVNRVAASGRKAGSSFCEHSIRASYRLLIEWTNKHQFSYSNDWHISIFTIHAACRLLRWWQPCFWCHCLIACIIKWQNFESKITVRRKSKLAVKRTRQNSYTFNYILYPISASFFFAILISTHIPCKTKVQHSNKPHKIQWTPTN